jgi:hypothetical protein
MEMIGVSGLEVNFDQGEIGNVAGKTTRNVRKRSQTYERLDTGNYSLCRATLSSQVGQLTGMITRQVRTNFHRFCLVDGHREEPERHGSPFCF